MSIGILAGIVDTSNIGASLIGNVFCSAGQSLSQDIPAPGSTEMTVFSYMAIPAVAFSATSTMIVPTIFVQKNEGGVHLTANGGNIPVNILIFGR